ncbi:MAG: hypothetical protein RLY98_442, partial [Bacteroidota bacterium]
QNNENCWKARLNFKKKPNLFLNWDFGGINLFLTFHPSIFHIGF